MFYIYITLLKFNKTQVFYLFFSVMVNHSSLCKAKVISSYYSSIIISFLPTHRSLLLLESPSLISVLLFFRVYLLCGYIHSQDILLPICVFNMISFFYYFILCLLETKKENNQSCLHVV